MASPFHLRRGLGAASARPGSDYPVRRRGRGVFRHDDSAANFPLPTRATGPRRAGNDHQDQEARPQNRGVPQQQRQQQEPIVAASSIPEHRRKRIWLPVDGPRPPDPENEGASECPSEPRPYPPPTHIEDRPDAFVVMEGGEASHRWMLPRGHVPSASVSVSREANAEPRRHRIRKGKGKGKARVELREEEEEAAASMEKQQRNSNNGVSSVRPTKRTITPPKKPRSRKPAASQHSSHFAAHSPNPDEDEVGSGDSPCSWVEVEEAEASSTVTGNDEKKISQALTEDEDDGYHQPPFIERFRSSGASHHETASDGQGGGRGAPAAAAAAAAAVQSQRRAGGGSVATNTPATTGATARVEDLISFEEEVVDSRDGVDAEDGEEEEEEEEEEDLIIFD
ncbi:MAG: hypothetical protein Q9197_002417 [Variospora fuerteventurae]